MNFFSASALLDAPIQVPTVQGRTVALRLVQCSDADFILKLRGNERKNRHLSISATSVAAQVAWLNAYKTREQAGSEFYFIIESLERTRLGTVRLYDIRGESFCWGSWIVIDDAPRSTAIESALLIYQFGFKKLGFSKSHFDVRKDNTRVVDFHLRMGAEKTDEDALNYYFEYSEKAFDEASKRYKRYLVS